MHRAILLPLALSAVVLSGCFHGPFLTDYPMLSGEMKAHFVITVATASGKYTLDNVSYEGVTESTGTWYSYWADTDYRFATPTGGLDLDIIHIRFPKLTAGTYTQDTFNAMTGSDDYYLLYVDWDGGYYTSNDSYCSYLGVNYRKDGDATVTIDGSDEKYIWGSFSGTLVTNLNSGVVGIPDFDTIGVTGKFVLMKDWYEL